MKQNKLVNFESTAWGVCMQCMDVITNFLGCRLHL